MYGAMKNISAITSHTTRINLLNYSQSMFCTSGISRLSSTNQPNAAQAPPSSEQPLPWQDEATLYIHWPFCQRRCTYCNFNKYIDRGTTDHVRMRQCLVTETANLLRLSEVKRIKSIFFGGGTPSLALPSTLHDVIDTVARVVAIGDDAEVTMEANPTSTESKKMKEFKAAGINRVSLGIQALNNADLKLLGRDHTAEESLRCIKEATHLFPGRVSVDLIFGRPNQTISSWKHELEEILQLCDNHISLYQLTLERGTALFKMHERGEVEVPDADLMAEMYECAVDLLADAGFVRYEVSNFARNGAESEHNKAYWTGCQYIGVGPGAHGRFIPRNERSDKSSDGQESRTGHQINTSCSHQKEARIQTLEPDPWMREVEQYGHGTRKRVRQSQIDVLAEILLLCMRSRHGVVDSRWREFSNGIGLGEIFKDKETVRRLVGQGLLEMDDRGMRSTGRGMSVLDSIVTELMVVLDHYHHTQ